MGKIWLAMVFILFSVSIEASSQSESRMNLLRKLDMLDALDFQELMDSANQCIINHNFQCADNKISKAKKMAATKSQLSAISYAKENLYAERALVREEKRAAERLRVARYEREKERKRELKREKKRKKERKKELKRERERERLRARNQQSSGSGWAGALAKGLDKASKSLPSIAETQRKLDASIQARIEQDKQTRRRKEADRKQARADQAYQKEMKRAQARRDQLQAERARREQVRKAQERRELARVEQVRKEKAQAERARKEQIRAEKARKRKAEKRAAMLANVEPKAVRGSIYRGNLNESEKVNCDCDGKITKRNFTVGSCKISTMTVAYKLDNLFGEPTVSGNYIWKAASGSKTDCLPYDFKVWLKLQNSNSYGYVKLNPTVPKAGRVSSNAKGSPNWDEFICGFNGKNTTQCFDSTTAKTLYKAGRVVGFEPSHRN